MALETTLVLIKPDGVRRNLVGEVIGRFERKGLHLVGLKLMTMSGDLADKHYAEHVSKGFYPELKAFMTGGPLVALAVRGENAIAMVRGMMGKTNPLDAAPGTIRGDFATTVGENIVHGSDGPESAAKELGLWFAEGFVTRT
ncbi:MAG: nucleoside-diphosphate kinase [Candidatus Sumerlaeia bacterium]|nr:nucleoside-diphosphate kinase [Candidatus Sumerlaeia bacterium]